MIFFTIAGAIHISRPLGAFQTISENSRIDIHHGVTPFAIWFVSERTDGIAVDIRQYAEPGSFSGASKAFYTGMTVGDVNIDQLGTCPIGNSGATGSSRAAVGVKNESRVYVGIHAHGLGCSYQHCFGLEYDNFRFILGQTKTNCAYSAAFIVGQNIIDKYFIHNFRAVFASFLGQTHFLIVTVIF